MTTPIIILLLLISPHLFSRTAGRAIDTRLAKSTFPAVIGIALVFGFTAIGHFVKTQAMAEMLPDFVPGRLAMVYVSGFVEAVAAVAILIPRFRRVVAWCLIVLLLSFLPVNIYAAMNQIGMGGHQWGPIYLLIRIPLQVILVAWVWYFAIHQASTSDTSGITA